MPTPRPWKLRNRLAMLKGEERLQAARERLKPSAGLVGPALLPDVAGRLRGALRIADVDREQALSLVAEAYLLVKVLLEDEE